MTKLHLPLPGGRLDLDWDYEPGDPGRTSGPPEDCYPPEPEMVEITEAVLWIRQGDLLVRAADLVEAGLLEECDPLREWLEEKALERERLEAEIIAAQMEDEEPLPDED